MFLRKGLAWQQLSAEVKVGWTSTTAIELKNSGYISLPDKEDSSCAPVHLAALWGCRCCPAAKLWRADLTRWFITTR
jgi:hypothetical protein